MEQTRSTVVDAANGGTECGPLSRIIPCNTEACPSISSSTGIDSIVSSSSGPTELSSSTGSSSVAPLVLDLRLSLEFDTVSNDLDGFKTRLLSELSSILLVPVFRIRVISVRAGSTIATVEIDDAPENTTTTLQQGSSEPETYPYLSQLSEVTPVTDSNSSSSSAMTSSSISSTGSSSSTGVRRCGCKPKF